MTTFTRRQAVRLLAAGSAGAWFAASQLGLNLALASPAAATQDSTPPLAPGAPTSAERIALIDTFKEKSAGMEKSYEARVYKGDWSMPYRLYRPTAGGKLPLVLYLHGSGGLGDDNQKQMGLGNIFGTRVWLLPENQKKFPCYVVVPQTDRGWIRYDPKQWAQGNAEVIAGLGEGARMAFAVVDQLRHEFAIDDTRIYVTGQSMGGAGTWNMISNRPGFFAAAVICCGSRSIEDGTGAINLPLWNFHGEADQTVPVSVSRDRMASRRKAGGKPLSTEYPGVDHNVWEWAYTEPELVKWVFAQRRTS
jgi:predicted peptidase